MIRFTLKSMASILLFLPILLLALSLTACEKEGPAEKAGEKVDEAVEETKEEAREAKETLEETYKKKTE